MTQFNTVTEEMHHVAADTRKAATDISAELQAVAGYCRSLTPWIGTASDQFQLLMQQFDKQAARLNDALTNIASELDENANNYELSEHANTKQIITVAQNLPSFNF